MIGALETRKNHALVLRALGLLARNDRKTTLHLVGTHRPPSPDTRAALDYALRCGVEVVHHGAVSDASVLSVADTCAALFYPSFNEGYGLPILEALSIRLPVIATDLPSSRAHPVILADTVLALMNDDDQYARLVASIAVDKIPVGFGGWIDALLHNGDATITG
jgi:glycosyltransferase involved in cell wall biosynthesis